MDSSYFLTLALSLLLKKVDVPSEFHSQAQVVRLMLKDDVSGLVSSLTDFSVSSALVDFGIETGSSTLNNILNKWLEEINIDYLGQIPTGIKPLASEYFKERWQGASFPILKIIKWGEIDGIVVPIKVCFVDGGSVYTKDKDEKNDTVKLLNYDYYLGEARKEALNKNVIITKPGCRIYEKYPTPYLIRRGVYHNWKIIDSLKNKQSEILDQVIPYLLLVQRGTEGLAQNSLKIYTEDEFKQIKTQIQGLMDKMDDSYIPDDNRTKKTPIRVTQFDEQIKHLIPDLSTIFKTDLFVGAEKNILSGLGFVDIIASIAQSRQEAVLNPKAFIEEINTGVTDFKQIVKDMVFLIKKQNENRPKYFGNTNRIYVTSSPVKGFMTDRFKQIVRQLWANGRLSDQTAIELIAEVDFQTEVYRKKRETKEGLETTFYPPLTQNVEDKGIDLPETTPKETDKNGNPIPPDKIDVTEKEEYNISGLVGAPYNNINDLPKRFSSHMTIEVQRVFLEAFNGAYKQYNGDEERAFKVAWSAVKNIAKKK